MTLHLAIARLARRNASDSQPTQGRGLTGGTGLAFYPGMNGTNSNPNPEAKVERSRPKPPPQFRIQPIRSGINYGFKYAASIEAAIRAARVRGFYNENPAPRVYDDRPYAVEIAERVEYGWEPIARITTDGIKVVSAHERDSVKSAKAVVEKFENHIGNAERIAEEIRCWSIQIRHEESK